MKGIGKKVVFKVKESVVFFDGSVLEGVFMNNYPEQKCSLSYLNGDHFDGLFVKGKRNGKGIWVCRGGFLKFDGFFVNDRMSGDFMISYINPSETRFGEITYQGQVYLIFFFLFDFSFFFFFFYPPHFFF